MIYRSHFQDIEVSDSLVTPFVLQHADSLSESTALIDGPSGCSMSYGELTRAIKSLAGGLLARGFARGDVLGIMAPNVPEYAVLFHGAAWAGGAVTTINPTYTAGEIHHQLVDSGAKFLIIAGMFSDTASEAVSGTGVEAVFTLEPGTGSSMEDLMGEPLEQHVTVDADDVVCLPYSSGTTGLSKGVMLTHRNLVANLQQTAVVLPIARGEPVLSFLPFFHIYGMQVLMNGGLCQGGTIITMPRFDLEQFLTLAQDHQVKRAFVVPPVVLALARHPLVDKFDLSKLDMVFSAAAPLGAALAAEAADRLQREVVQGYGMTELSPVSHATPAGQFKAGAVGLLLPSTECRVIDAAGDDLSLGENGEILVRGPQVMKGYLNNSQATAVTLDGEGWLHTGDIGHVDEDGQFTIVDRLKELIKYKGFQVPPAELEALLVSHPAVADAAVIGVPDDEAGELPKAFIVCKPELETSAEAIQHFVAERVAHYKQVRIIEFADEIPKSASGKILRRMLRDRS